MNWGAPVANGGLGEAINPPSNLTQPVDTTASGGSGFVINDQVSITSNMLVERADNTEYAWSNAMSAWVSPTMVYNVAGETITTFDGHFNAPSFETQAAPYGPNNYQYQFGDPLLGAVSNPSSPQTEADMTFNFSQALFGVAFQVSNISGTDTNFIALLKAYDGSGNLIGVYKVDTNGAGVGGACPGLLNPVTAPFFSDPSPCNDAPTIQFYDPEGRIASVVLSVNDNQGLMVDSMFLDVTTPDPGPATLIGGGLVLFALLTKRLTKLRDSKAKEEGPRV